MIEQTFERVNNTPLKLRSFFEERFVDQKVSAALQDPNTKEVRAVKVGRNEFCPCGRGDKFKKCCLWKVNSGVEIVGNSSTA